MWKGDDLGKYSMRKVNCFIEERKKSNNLKLYLKIDNFRQFLLESTSLRCCEINRHNPIIRCNAGENSAALVSYDYCDKNLQESSYMKKMIMSCLIIMTTVLVLLEYVSCWILKDRGQMH